MRQSVMGSSRRSVAVTASILGGEGRDLAGIESWMASITPPPWVVVLSLRKIE